MVCHALACNKGAVLLHVAPCVHSPPPPPHADRHCRTAPNCRSFLLDFNILCKTEAGTQDGGRERLKYYSSVNLRVDV